MRSSKAAAALVACQGLVLLAACDRPVEGPLDPEIAPPSFSVQPGDELDELAARVEGIRDRLAGSSYRALFGRPQGSGGGSVTVSALSAARAFGLPSFSLAASAASAPRDQTDVLVNDPAGPGIGQSEVSVASSGATIVAAWNDARGFFIFDDGVSGWGISTDRGRTWTDGGSFPRMDSPGFFHSGDPALAVGGGNHFFFGDLCFDFDTSPATSGICMTRGRAGGGTVGWGTPVFAASSLPDFLDKPLAAVDHQGDDVYVSYTRFIGGGGFGQIEVVASHDGGASFGAPVVVAVETPGLVNQGSEPAVAPDGTVYVVWERNWLTSLTPDVVVSRSMDGGATFGPQVVVDQITSIAFTPPSGYNRPVINDFPRIAVARTGTFKGRVFVTYHDADLGEADVFISHSDDGGTTWSAPVRVNDDGPGALQFWPVVHVEPGGNVDVVWYDRRLNPGTPLTDTFWSQSTDGGATWRANVRLSDVSTNWAATATDIIPNFGDYNDISTSGNKTFAAWGDGRLGDPDVFFSELKGAGKSRK